MNREVRKAHTHGCGTTGNPECVVLNCKMDCECWCHNPKPMPASTHAGGGQLAALGQAFAVLDSFVNGHGAVTQDEIEAAHQAVHDELRRESESLAPGAGLEDGEYHPAPRSPTVEECNAIIEMARFGQPFDEARDQVANARIAVFDHYISDGPGYTGRVAVVVWSGGPDLSNVFTLDGKHAGMVADTVLEDRDSLLNALRAIKARIEGEFDHPLLVALGPLGKIDGDIGTIVKNALNDGD